MSKNAIGVMGGSFNPIHKGHISAARYAQKTLNLSKVFFIPAGIPPHKALPEGSPSALQRLEMTKIAVRELPFAEVLDIEIKRHGKSYTIDTIYELKKRYADTDIYFIMGTDMFLSFEKWYRADELSRLIKIAVVRRRGQETEKIREKTYEYQKELSADVIIIDSPVLEISSTEIREQLRLGKGEEWLPGDVLTYIERNKLYF
ncbi:MAG: nicotinate-nucleotide adenylyltransferase [Clostridiales bacterium]|nr:nicotinate-nucleotide adenylyltransferase [Clostridiales bacterium]